MKELSHNRLIQILAHSLQSESLWREFIRRYHQFIAKVIIYDCKRLGYDADVNDLLQDFYLLLLQNHGRVLDQFKGKNACSILSYLRLIAQCCVRDAYKKHRRAPKFCAFDDAYMTTYDDAPVLDLIADIDHHIEAVLCKNRKAARDKKVIYASLCGFTCTDISLLGFGIDRKRAANLVAETRRALRERMA